MGLRPANPEGCFVLGGQGLVVGVVLAHQAELLPPRRAQGDVALLHHLLQRLLALRHQLVHRLVEDGRAEGVLQELLQLFVHASCSC
eukprot:12106102-Alexandrium_andersonii.AAC.1